MRAALIGIGVNAALALVKATAGVAGHSFALVADAVESASDVLTSLIVWIGLRTAARPSDENHPFGHGKAEPLATLAVSLALLGAAGGIAFQSVHEIRTPHHAPEPFTLLVLLLVVGVKEALFRRVIRIGQDVGSSAVQGDAWHHRSDALTSAAAFGGISVALIGGPGWEVADDWAALAASLVIAVNGVRLLGNAVLELTDAVPDPAVERGLRAVASSVPGVLGLHRCRVLKMGFEYYIDLDVIVDRDIPVHAGHAIAHAVQDAVRRSNPRIARVLVHVEPNRPV